MLSISNYRASNVAFDALCFERFWKKENELVFVIDLVTFLIWNRRCFKRQNNILQGKFELESNALKSLL